MMGESPFDNDEGAEQIAPSHKDGSRRDLQLKNLRVLTAVMAEQTAPQRAAIGRPHLRLKHLFVLTAVMAVLLGINGPQRDYIRGGYQPSAFLVVLWRSLGVVHTLLSAAALTAFGYGLAAYRRGLRFFDQPGHWLLLEISVSALLGIAPSVAYRWMTNYGKSESANALASISLFLMGYWILFLFFVPLVLNIYIGATRIRERRWKTVFYLKALSTVLFGLGGLFVFIATIFATTKDRKERAPCDAGHQCGVWIQLALSSLTLVSGISFVYNFVGVFYR